MIPKSGEKLLCSYLHDFNKFLLILVIVVEFYNRADSISQSNHRIINYLQRGLVTITA